MKIVYIQQIQRTRACKCRVEIFVEGFCFFTWMSYYIPIFYNVIWFYFYFVLIELFEVAIELFGIALEGCSEVLEIVIFG